MKIQQENVTAFEIGKHAYINFLHDKNIWEAEWVDLETGEEYIQELDINSLYEDIKIGNYIVTIDDIKQFKDIILELGR